MAYRLSRKAEEDILDIYLTGAVKVKSSKAIIVAIFLSVGPPIGWLALLTGCLVAGAEPDSLERRAIASPLLMLITTLYSYFLGGLPSLLTGLAAANLFEDLIAPIYIVACGLAGAFASGAVFIAPMLAAPLEMLPFVATGGFAGLACGALTCRLRSRLNSVA